MDAVDTTRYREDKRTMELCDSYRKAATWYYESNPGSPPDMTSLNTLANGWNAEGLYTARAMHDNVTPQFTVRRNKGEIIMNDKQMTKKTVVWDTPTVFSCERDYGWYSKHAAGQMSTFHMWNSDPFPSLPSTGDDYLDTRRALLVARLHAKIGKAPFDYITSMMEAHKTMRSLNRAGRAVATILASVKNKTILHKRKKITAAALADAYLEARYSLRPLIYEIKGAIEAAENYGKPHKLAIHLNDKMQESTSEFVNSTSQGTTGNLNQIQYDVTDVTETQLFAGAVLSFKTTTQGTVDVLGIDNILNSALELTKFSFIADWFINLFDWINSWTPEYGVDVEGTYLTVIEDCKRTIRANSVYSSYTSSSDPDYSHNGTVLRTSRDRRFGNPSRPYLPRVKIRLDGLKLLDVYAIFGGLVTDFKRWKI